MCQKNNNYFGDKIFIINFVINLKRGLLNEFNLLCNNFELFLSNI